jgi:DNA (cytosine-5)-methyltransferase 3A
MKFKNKKTGEIKEFEPLRIDAALVSAQRRVRLFWTNIPDVVQPEDRGILLKDILEPKVDEVFTVKPKSNTVHSSGRGSGIDDKHNWDTIRIGQIGKGGQGDRIYSTEGKSVGLSALGGGRGAKTGLYSVALRNRGQGKKPEIGGDKANAMTTVQTDSMVMKDTIIRKLTPVECERLQGLKDNYTEGVSNSQRYKMLGNAFNVDVVSHILSFLALTNLLC